MGWLPWFPVVLCLFLCWISVASNERQRNLGDCCNLVDLEIWSFIKEQKSYVHCENSLKESSERQNPEQNERLEN